MFRNIKVYNVEKTWLNTYTHNFRIRNIPKGSSVDRELYNDKNKKKDDFFKSYARLNKHKKNI